MSTAKEAEAGNMESAWLMIKIHTITVLYHYNKFIGQLVGWARNVNIYVALNVIQILKNRDNAEIQTVHACQPQANAIGKNWSAQKYIMRYYLVQNNLNIVSTLNQER